MKPIDIATVKIQLIGDEVAIAVNLNRNISVTKTTTGEELDARGMLADLSDALQSAGHDAQCSTTRLVNAVEDLLDLDEAMSRQPVGLPS